ncbi:MAG: cell wall anchor protein [Microbacteriaceae bacterium]|nr:cell wall anchor protein [Microbacteriaceae bacterium]
MRVNRAGGICHAALALAVALALAAAPTSPPAAAHDTSHVVEVSLDAVSFSRVASDFLFRDVGPIIPGASVERPIWIRNASAYGAIMSVRVTDLLLADPEFAESVTIEGSAGAVPGDVMKLGELDQCHVIVSDQHVPAGGTLQVDVTLTMLDVEGQIAQGQFGTLALLIGMRDSVAPVAAGGCGEGGTDPGAVPVFDPPTSPAQPSALALTGGEPVSVFFGIAGLLAGGIFFVIAGRRRRRAEA